MNKLREYISALVYLFSPDPDEKLLPWTQFYITLILIIILLTLTTIAQVKYLYN